MARIPLLLQSFSSFPFFPDNQRANHRIFAEQLTKTQEINPKWKAPTQKPQPNHILIVQSHQLSLKPQPNLKKKNPNKFDPKEGRRSFVQQLTITKEINLVQLLLFSVWSFEAKHPREAKHWNQVEIPPSKSHLQPQTRVSCSKGKPRWHLVNHPWSWSKRGWTSSLLHRLVP